ncbi:MAG: arylsulfatase [Planctomycetaceae bacterium]
MHEIIMRLCLVAVLVVPAAAAERPNVIVILTDDQGWGDLSLNGNRNLSTPNIDQLAADGARIDRFFVCPVCSPTRAEFLTGRYHPRGGVYSTSAGGERLDLDEKTIGDTFRAAGYRTAAFGKWHNGTQYPYHPNARGFEEFYGFCSGHWGHYFSPMLEHNGRIVQGDGFITDDLTNKAIEFIRSHQSEPFFVYLAYNTPHSPMQVPDRWWNRFRDAELKMHNRDPDREDINHIRAALAMCENVDWNIGRLLQTLDEAHLSDNTIVVYFCDNGPNGWRWNGGMKGRKGSTDEGGVRSPLLVRWPGRIEPGSLVTQIAAAIDLHPTLAELADIDTKNDKPFDGLSLKPLLLSAKAEWPERLIVSSWRDSVSVRSQRYRLDTDGRLFDMAADPGQDTDVSQQHPEITATMKAEAKRYRDDVMPGYDDDHRPFVIAHPDAAVTQLPARDATSLGMIERSNRFPNSSFFTNWTSTDDALLWKAEVLATGDYEVDIYYTCPESSVGTELRLSFNDDSLTSTITTAHESELVGAAQDRVPRQESYEQHWARMTAGTIHLNSGTGTLELRATKIPGDRAMDFRLLTLTRKIL